MGKFYSLKHQIFKSEEKNKSIMNLNISKSSKLNQDEMEENIKMLTEMGLEM